MKNLYSKVIPIILFGLLITPSIVFASWWNPATWFNSWSFSGNSNASTTALTLPNTLPANFNFGSSTQSQQLPTGAVLDSTSSVINEATSTEDFWANYPNESVVAINQIKYYQNIKDALIPVLTKEEDGVFNPLNALPYDPNNQSLIEADSLYIDTLKNVIQSSSDIIDDYGSLDAAFENKDETDFTYWHQKIYDEVGSYKKLGSLLQQRQDTKQSLAKDLLNTTSQSASSITTPTGTTADTAIPTCPSGYTCAPTTQNQVSSQNTTPQSTIQNNSYDQLQAEETQKQNSAECQTATSNYNAIEAQIKPLQDQLDSYQTNFEMTGNYSNMQQQSSLDSQLATLSIRESGLLDKKLAACEIFTPTPPPTYNTNCQIYGDSASCTTN